MVVERKTPRTPLYDLSFGKRAQIARDAFVWKSRFYYVFVPWLLGSRMIKGGEVGKGGKRTIRDSGTETSGLNAVLSSMCFLAFSIAPLTRIWVSK